MDNMVDGRAGTPLILPAPLSAEEHQAFIADHGLPEFHFTAKFTVAGLMEDNLSPTETALVREYAREGVLPLMAIQQIVYLLCGNISNVQFFNMLLTARKLADYPDVNLTYFVTLSSIVRRLTDHEPTNHKRLSTKEGLAGYAAVAALAMNPKAQSLKLLKEPRQLAGGNFYQYAIANEHLEALLRERPDRLSDIISYIKERGIHRTNKTPVEGLRGYLDLHTNTPAISEGWL